MWAFIIRQQYVRMLSVNILRTIITDNPQGEKRERDRGEGGKRQGREWGWDRGEGERGGERMGMERGEERGRGEKEGGDGEREGGDGERERENRTETESSTL